MSLEFLNVLKFVTQHPLNSDEPLKAVQRFLAWQIGSRILKNPVAVPFVHPTRLLVSCGMTGATGNIYAGLHEVEEMALILHLLRPEDEFVDVGANIGSYTVLAAGAVGASCISIEPIPATFKKLQDNIFLNRLHERVSSLNIGLGDKESAIRFSSNEDTMNHVLAENETSFGGIEVQVKRLDDILMDHAPTLMKMDVEGFELAVLQGGSQTLAKSSLLAIVIETNESGNRYGHSDKDIDGLIRQYGFKAARYDPFARQLSLFPAGQWHFGNTIYVRDLDAIETRVKFAQRYKLATGKTI